MVLNQKIDNQLRARTECAQPTTVRSSEAPIVVHEVKDLNVAEYNSIQSKFNLRRDQSTIQTQSQLSTEMEAEKSERQPKRKTMQMQDKTSSIRQIEASEIEDFSKQEGDYSLNKFVVKIK